jgi:biuret amidohydrolase
MDFNSTDTALVVIDPQNDFLSPDGVTWGLVGNSVEANGTVDCPSSKYLGLLAA